MFSLPASLLFCGQHTKEELQFHFLPIWLSGSLLCFSCASVRVCECTGKKLSLLARFGCPLLLSNRSVCFAPSFCHSSRQALAPASLPMVVMGLLLLLSQLLLFLLYLREMFLFKYSF